MSLAPVRVMAPAPVEATVALLATNMPRRPPARRHSPVPVTLTLPFTPEMATLVFRNTP